jgi:putative Holliday junction resolvase
VSGADPEAGPAEERAGLPDEPAAGGGAPGFRRGVRLGVDVGSVRIGLALCDPDGVLASPLETVARDMKRGSDLTRIAHLVAEREVIEVIVGLPRSLSGTEGRAALAVRDYTAALTARLAPIPVHLSDERLTTVIAGRTLTQRGVRGSKRRAVVDQAAAVLILQGWLDAERRSGRP